MLDVGCGGGLLSERFAQLGCKVTGVDQSLPTLAAAREHAAATGLDIRYLAGDAQALPIADASFDVASCCDVLEHVDDVDRVVAGIARGRSNFGQLGEALQLRRSGNLSLSYMGYAIKA